MKFLKILAISAFLSACSINHGTNLNAQNVYSIQRGVTTEMQIRQMFGEPVSVETNAKINQKTLTYRYDNDESIQKTVASLGGAIVGGVLGHQVGGGMGQDLATGVGAIAGGALAENAVTTREEQQVLTVYIDLRTGVVADYNFIENKGRSQSWGVGSGVGAL